MGKQQQPQQDYPRSLSFCSCSVWGAILHQGQSWCREHSPSCLDGVSPWQATWRIYLGEACVIFIKELFFFEYIIFRSVHNVRIDVQAKEGGCMFTASTAHHIHGNLNLASAYYDKIFTRISGPCYGST